MDRASLRRLDCGGFSLVEVTVTLGVVAIGLVGVIAVLGVGLGSARVSSAENRAVIVARSVIADLKSDATDGVLGERAGQFMKRVLDEPVALPLDRPIGPLVLHFDAQQRPVDADEKEWDLRCEVNVAPHPLGKVAVRDHVGGIRDIALDAPRCSVVVTPFGGRRSPGERWVFQALLRGTVTPEELEVEDEKDNG